MNKRETFNLLSIIASFYDQFQIDQDKIDRWFHVLKSYSFENLEKNLYTFVVDSPYPPRISDLVKKPEVVSRAIPNRDETEGTMLTNRKPPASQKWCKSIWRR